jgi:hypothetical protein
MSKAEIGYVVWGVVTAAVVVPELVAIFGGRFAPFPGLARTATNLEARVPWLAMLFLAGLAILAVHIVFYPWPD